jgi:hypothetical protein
LKNVWVCGGVGDDGDARVVFRGGADHGGAADVDLLDALVGVGAGGDGGLERVEVRHEQLERGYAELRELGCVLGLAGVSEEASVDRGVQGLDPAV